MDKKDSTKLDKLQNWWLGAFFVFAFAGMLSVIPLVAIFGWGDVTLIPLGLMGCAILCISVAIYYQRKASKLRHCTL